MLFKILEFFGLWKSPEVPVMILERSTCDTLDSMVLLKVASSRRRAQSRRI